MQIKNFVAAGFVVLPVITMLGNGCTLHQTLQGFADDGGLFGDSARSSVKDSGHRDSSTGTKDGAIDMGSDGAVTGTCAPGDVSSLNPTFRTPSVFHQGLCSPSQVSAFVDCLSNVPDATTCKTFMTNAANTSCTGCALTKDTASTYGPLVEGSVTIEINVAGCVGRATSDLTSTGCGAHLAARSQCEALACETNCPVPATDDGTAFSALLQCQTSSDSSVCKPYADAAACADALVDGGMASVCASGGSTFSENAKAMVGLFCGT